MRQAIITKYLGHTNSRGSRVKAKCRAGAVTVPWQPADDVETNHLAAATALAAKFCWPGILVGGDLPDNTGYAFVLVASPVVR